MVTKERYGDYKEVKEIFLEHLVESDCGYKAGAGGGAAQFWEIEAKVVQ